MMKTEFKFFSVVQHEEEEAYLREMHNAGWRFTSVSSIGLYRFEACEAEDVVYRLDYNAEGIAHKDEYIRLFSDCGWEYLQDYVGFSYFRKSAAEADGNEEIFCDEESRREMMTRVAKGRMLPLLVLFFAVLLPQFVLQLCVYHSTVLTAVFGGLIGLYLVLFLAFAWKYYAYAGDGRR